MTTVDCEFVHHDGKHLFARVIVSNSARLNIIDQAATVKLAEVLRQAGEQPELRAVLLTGAGERAFIGGADIRQMATFDPPRAEAFISDLQRACQAIRDVPVPVVAAIRGYCLGAGLEIAAACDLRLAGDDALFGMPEVNVGLPSVIEAALLPRLVGWGRASRLLYTGETIDAATAYNWGLVEEVVAAADLNDSGERLLRQLFAGGPGALKLQKALLRDWEELPLDKAIERGVEVFRRAYESDEPKRMMNAFLNRKRDQRG